MQAGGDLPVRCKSSVSRPDSTSKYSWHVYGIFITSHSELLNCINVMEVRNTRMSSAMFVLIRVLCNFVIETYSSWHSIIYFKCLSNVVFSFCVDKSYTAGTARMLEPSFFRISNVTCFPFSEHWNL
jgi:hypothetical protein